MDFSSIRRMVGDGDVAAVRRLIATGWDVDEREYWTGTTALCLAANAGDAEMVEVLLQHGADPDSQDYDGYYAYGIVVTRRVRELLLAYGFSQVLWQPTVGPPGSVMQLRVLAPRPVTNSWTATVTNGDLFVEHLLVDVPRPAGRIEVAVRVPGHDGYAATLSTPGIELHRLTAADAAPATATITVTCTEFVGETYVRLFSSAAVDRLDGARTFWLPPYTMYQVGGSPPDPRR